MKDFVYAAHCKSIYSRPTKQKTKTSSFKKIYVFIKQPCLTWVQSYPQILLCDPASKRSGGLEGLPQSGIQRFDVRTNNINVVCSIGGGVRR